jgi:hypothetical protein
MKVKFLQPVDHDADHFEIGDKADLPADAAKALIACGHAELNDPAALKAEAKAQADAAAAAEAESKANAEAAEKLAADEAASKG